MEKTATADARVTRVSRKLNESTRVYLALFCLALEERTKRKRRARYILLRRAIARKSQTARESKNESIHSGNASNTPNLRSFI